MFGGHRPCRWGDITFSIVTWIHAIMWSEDHLTLWVSFPHHQLRLCKVWWPSTLRKSRYFVFNLSRNLMWPRGHRVMWHYGWVPLIISLHPAKFGGHKRCAREETLFFVCHVTSRDFVVRESCDIMGEFPSSLVSRYPVKFGDHRPFGRGHIKLSICHVTSCDQVVRGSCDIMCELSSSKLPPC